MILRVMMIALLGIPCGGIIHAQTPLERLERQVAGDLAATKPLPDPAAGAEPEPVAESGYFGIIGDSCPDGTPGVQVLEVVLGGPAAQAGMVAGDIITGLAGQPIRSAEEFSAIAIRLAAGNEVELQLLRSGKPARVLVRLDRRPSPQNTPPPNIDSPIEPPNLPPHPDPATAASIRALNQRIEALEQRIQRLEQLVLELSKTFPPEADSPP